MQTEKSKEEVTKERHSGSDVCQAHSLEPAHGSAVYEHVYLRDQPCLNINIIITAIGRGGGVGGSCLDSLAALFSVRS